MDGVFAQEPTHARVVVLLPTQTLGVDPFAGRFVDRALRTASEAAGYRPLPNDAGLGALSELAASDPPSVADLWRITYRVQADRGVHAVVWAKGGRYVVQVRVACLDGSGPFYAQGDAGETDLEQRSAALLNQAFAQADASTQAASPAPPSIAPTPSPAKQTEHFFVDDRASAAREPERFRLALHNDLAFGIAKQSFINDVVGARADLRLAPASFIGAYLGYATLPGREGRVQSLLFYAQLEQRIPIANSALALPLRFDLGYLARNGAFLRLASGLAIALGRSVEVVLDLLAPAFWTTPDRTLFSLNLGTELNIQL